MILVKMNLEIDVLVNQRKVASKRSWMSEPLDYRYPAILVYDVKGKSFLDQIAYRPGPIAIEKGNKVGGSYNIPKEFRLDFHLTLDAAAAQPTSGCTTGCDWNILRGAYSIIYKRLKSRSSILNKL